MANNNAITEEVTAEEDKPQTDLAPEVRRGRGAPLCFAACARKDSPPAAMEGGGPAPNDNHNTVAKEGEKLSVLGAAVAKGGVATANHGNGGLLTAMEGDAVTSNCRKDAPAGEEKKGSPTTVKNARVAARGTIARE